MQAEDSARVQAVVERMLDAIDHGDTAILESLWLEQSSMFFPFLNSPQLAVGRAAIVARFAALFGKFRSKGAATPYFGFQLQDLRVDVMGDAALCTLSYVLRGVLARRSFVLVRAAGDWRIKHVHGSNAKLEERP
jgi:ketosteroid isomerase-like protein